MIIVEDEDNINEQNAQENDESNALGWKRNGQSFQDFLDEKPKNINIVAQFRKNG